MQGTLRAQQPRPPPARMAAAVSAAACCLLLLLGAPAAVDAVAVMAAGGPGVEPEAAEGFVASVGRHLAGLGAGGLVGGCPPLTPALLNANGVPFRDNCYAGGECRTAAASSRSTVAVMDGGWVGGPLLHCRSTGMHTDRCEGGKRAAVGVRPGCGSPVAAFAVSLCCHGCTHSLLLPQRLCRP